LNSLIPLVNITNETLAITSSEYFAGLPLFFLVGVLGSFSFLSSWIDAMKPKISGKPGDDLSFGRDLTIYPLIDLKEQREKERKRESKF